MNEVFINIDAVVFSWYASGGISVYFKELFSGLTARNIPHAVHTYGSDHGIFNAVAHDYRKFERYRACLTEGWTGIFHSTYYRLPTSKSMKVVTTVHDFIYERYIGGIRAAIHSSQKFRAIRALDVIICVSENTKSDLLEFLPECRDKDIRVVYNGVNRKYFPLSPFVCETNEPPFVLFVGARAGYKNFLKAVQAISLIPGIVLKVVGGGNLTSHEVSYLNRYLLGRYHVLGFVEIEQLNKLFNDAVCLIYPSVYEGFGIPVAEAMAAGCPVICVNSSSIPEVAGNAAVLLEVPDPQLIASAVTNLTNCEVRDKHISIGLKQSSIFSWERMVEQTLLAYGV